MTTKIKHLFHPDGNCVDLTIEEGRIIQIAESSPANEPNGDTVIDASGYLLLPAMVDAHTHLDKTVLGMPWFCNDMEDKLSVRIQNERDLRTQLGLDPYQQACRYIERAIGHGVLALRTHVDVDTQNGLKGLEGVLRAKEDYRDYIQIETVAFPQSGVLGRPGTTELLKEAMRMGADLVGGLDPANIDRDPVRCLDTLFSIADQFGKGIDIHLHEPNELGLFDLSLILDRTRSLGMQDMVSVSHAFCLGYPAAANVYSDLANEQIHIITSANAHMPNVPPVRKLVEAGVDLCGGNDNVRDLWSPFGSGDMLERALFIAMRHNYRRDEDLELCFQCCTKHGARLMHLSGYGITEGCNADLMLVKARNIPEAVVSCPKERLILKNGELIAQDGELLKRP